MNKKIIYLYIFVTVCVILWCGGFVAAPLVDNMGYTSLSNALYELYSKVCHQHKNSSFHIEGKNFGVCIRCTAIYFGFLFTLLIIPLLHNLKQLRPGNSVIFIFSLLPMLADVALNAFGIFRSTIETKLITGFIFGCSVSWFISPLLIEAFLQVMNRTNIIKLRRVQNVRET